MELVEARDTQEKTNQNESKDSTSPFFAAKQPLDFYYVFISFFILLGPFLMGCMINAMANSDKIFERFVFLKNRAGVNATVSDIKATLTYGGFFPLGGLIGALLGGIVTDKCGRKYSTMFLAQVMVIGNVLKVISYSTNIWLFYSGRLFDGIASGSLMVCCINWLLEVQPTRLHSAVKPLIQILINAGILVFGCLASDFAFNDKWYLLYWVAISGCGVLTLVSVALPESYKFIYQHTRNENITREYLQMIRGDGYMESELLNVVNQVNSSSSVKQMSMMTFLKTKRFLPGIISGIYINLAQQITGINAIVAFTANIIDTLTPEAVRQHINSSPNSELSFSALAQKYITLIILASGFLGSIAFAKFVSNYRRKLMLIIGFGGMTISLCLTMLLNAWGSNAIATGICLGSFLLIFQVGPGPLVWFITSEIFPTETHTAALSLTTVANWFGNSCIYFLFPIVNAQIQINSLYIFMGLNVITLFFLSFLMEETLGKSPDEVLENYQRRWHMQ